MRAPDIVCGRPISSSTTPLMKSPRIPLSDASDDVSRSVLQANLVAVLAISRDATPALCVGRPIVLISSIQTRASLPRPVPYVTAKGGIASMSRALAAEVAPFGIRVNGIAPGAVATPGMWERSSLESSVNGVV